MASRNIFVSGPACFLRHPCGCRGHWMKTDRCVAFVACPSCGADRGEPCIGVNGQMASTHTVRRDDYQDRKAELEPKRGSMSLNIMIEDSR
jgi:hypothetical protein